MPLRLLCGIAGLLLVAIVWQAWGYQRLYRAMDYMAVHRSIGAAPENALATVHVYFDYMDPLSRAASPAIVQAVETMGEVRAVFHAVPVSPAARKAAEIAYAAGMQGKFSEMHEILIRNEEPLAEGRIRALAANAGADYERLMKDSGGPAVAAMLQGDALTRKSLNLAAIPAFILNGDILYSPSGQAGAGNDFRMQVQADIMRNFVPLLNEARKR